MNFRKFFRKYQYQEAFTKVYNAINPLRANPTK